MSKIHIYRSIEEIIVIAASIIIALSVLPFAVFRLYQGQYLIALVEVLGVVLIAGLGVYVWQFRNYKHAAKIVSMMILIGVVGLTYLIDAVVVYWLYPAVVAVYFLNTTWVSALMTIPAIISVLPILYKALSAIELATTLVTMLITMVFSHIVSQQLRQQHQRLQYMADLDGLTNLKNRRALNERMEFLANYHFRQNRREEHKNITSIILFDIDHFKQLNDNFGHITGDEVLIKLAQLVSSSVRCTDEIFRFGGEEFVVIANDTNLMNSSKLAEKIRLMIAEATLCDSCQVTASFGVAELSNNESAEQWLDRADDALYRAKRAGRNRVYLAHPRIKHEELPSYHESLS